MPLAAHEKPYSTIYIVSKSFQSNMSSSSLILFILVLLHHLQDMAVLILAQPPVFLRALSLLRNQLPIDYLLHFLKIDISNLVSPHASC